MCACYGTGVLHPNRLELLRLYMKRVQQLTEETNQTQFNLLTIFITIITLFALDLRRTCFLLIFSHVGVS